MGKTGDKRVSNTIFHPSRSTASSSTRKSSLFPNFFWTEWRARVAVESLRKLQVDRAVVRRDGQSLVVDAATVVPGDILMLGEGDAIAAAARLLAANELRLNEAPLTGESVPRTS